MKTIFNNLIIIGLTLFGSHLFAQPYVKFEGQPPMEIEINATRVKNIEVKYNVPSNGLLYLTLVKDGKGIGNTFKPITRGKRIVKLSISIWDGNEITKKGEYKYKLQVLKEKGVWKNLIAGPVFVDGVKAVKAKKT